MKRNKKERLLILQNLILSEPQAEVVIDEDDILDTMEDYVDKLTKEQRRLYKLYYIDMVNHRDLGVRYGCTGSSISHKIKLIGIRLRELIHGTE